MSVFIERKNKKSRILSMLYFSNYTHIPTKKNVKRIVFTCALFSGYYFLRKTKSIRCFFSLLALRVKTPIEDNVLVAVAWIFERRVDYRARLIAHCYWVFLNGYLTLVLSTAFTTEQTSSYPIHTQHHCFTGRSIKQDAVNTGKQIKSSQIREWRENERKRKEKKAKVSEINRW